jgi:hypothetical protein
MTVTSSGILFGPTGSGKTYLSAYEHRGANARKSRWANSVPPVREYGIFKESDDSDWRDDLGHYWGILDKVATVLGDAGERLSKFPANGVASVPWHGYPVSPRVRGKFDAPSFRFVEEWRARGAITRTVARKIQRRKL